MWTKLVFPRNGFSQISKITSNTLVLSGKTTSSYRAKLTEPQREIHTGQPQNCHRPWRVAPYPDIPDAYADQNESKVTEEDFQGDKLEKKLRKHKVFRIKKKPFDSSNRPDASFKVHEAGLKAPGGLETPTGWVHTKGKLSIIEPPTHISATIDKMLKGEFHDVGTNLQQHLAAGVKLRHYLGARKLPQEDRDLKNAWEHLEQDARERLEEAKLMAEKNGTLFDRIEVETKIQKDIRKAFERKVGAFEWEGVDFEDKVTAWSYFLVKSAFDYAAIKMVLAEIKEESAHLAEQEGVYKPRTLFDFGSGVGTSYWAVNEMFGYLDEAVFIDTSSQMHSLAKRILMKGKTESKNLPGGRFFRHQMSKDHKLKYDLVTCAFTLSEIPAERERLALITELWMKTQDYLIIVDHGSNAGFQVVAEARNLLNTLSKMTPAEAIKALRMNEDRPELGADPEMSGHLFAPCPHEKPCPRYEQDTIPCNFRARYKNFDLDKIPRSLKSMIYNDTFSYVVFKKGERSPTNREWHRLVNDPIINSKCAICQLCTERGRLEESYSHKEVDKSFFLYSKKAVLGQRFHVNLTYKDSKSDSPSNNVKPGSNHENKSDNSTE